MQKSSIKVDYSDQLDPLAKLLSGVNRPGDFYAAGCLQSLMPRLDISGVGTISFPLPEVQAKEIMRKAELAPYGRGEETLVDTQVRRVWQVPPDRVQLTGTGWTNTLEAILVRAVRGLGCETASVSAELYKLLLYDAGGFFISHRDTEKTEGMFGTLVITLPSFHKGGDLVIRHAGREVPLDLATREVSEVRYAAFYADCQHEVKPVTEGYRLCLIYNLVQRGSGGGPLSAPLYDTEAREAGRLLREWGECSDAPPKLVYLLEHQYSPAGLSFGGLKNGDAALGKVLSEAARHAGFVIHLGIVHITESGAAMIDYDDSYRYRSRRYRYSYRENQEAENSAGRDENFEVIDVCDARQYVSNWVDLAGEKVDFGELPLGENELMPAGALDHEKPDEQRVSEATGNEGASFERAYHRAVLVLWREDRYAEVLLQAGVGAVLPYFEKQVDTWIKEGKPDSDRDRLTGLAQLITDAWESDRNSYRSVLRDTPAPDRSVMLQLLRELGDAAPLEHFIRGVVESEYDGTENKELVACYHHLGAQQSGKLLSRMVEHNMALYHSACVDLLGRLVKETGKRRAPADLAACRAIAEAAVRGLTGIKQAPSYQTWSPNWARRQESKPVDASLVSKLLKSLHQLDLPKLSESAAEKLSANPDVFVPDAVLVPAISDLYEKRGTNITADPGCLRLWQKSAEVLLKRSEVPPAEPQNWTQNVRLECKCADCRELQRFAAAPEERVHRFSVRKDRRQHLHIQIEHHGLDMTHETERVGSPQTLVCTKTRRTYQKQCEQYARDVECFRTLAEISERLPSGFSELVQRVKAAIRE